MGVASLRQPSTALQETLACNIRRFRASNSWSQEQLADKCNLHRTYIGSIERCERNVTLSTLELLANALSTTVPDLLRDLSVADFQSEAAE